MSAPGPEIRPPLSPPATIQRLGLSGAHVILPRLRSLLDGAYHDSHMYWDLTEDVEQLPDMFQLFVACTENEPDTPVGVAVVEEKVHPAFNYHGIQPVHIKRFTVSDAHRSKGIGKQLLDEAKSYAFEESGLKAMFGESNELGAISMYGREGALYSIHAIAEYWRRNTPEQALAFFAADITDPARREERYSHGEGIRFVFAGDEETEQFFRWQGYLSKEQLLRMVEEQQVQHEGNA